MKCQINNQLKLDLPQHKLDRLGKTGRYLQLRSFTLDPASWWLSQSCDSYAAAFCCRDVGPNGPNNKHSLEEHLWYVASTTSTVAPFRVARLGWLPSKAKLPKCQNNNQLKPGNPQHKPGSPWENWSLPTTSQLHLSCTA